MSISFNYVLIQAAQTDDSLPVFCGESGWLSAKAVEVGYLIKLTLNFLIVFQAKDFDALNAVKNKLKSSSKCREDLQGKVSCSSM